MENTERGSAIPYLSAKDVTQLTGVSISTIYQLCRSGKIPHFTFGGQKRFRLDQINEWLKQQQHGQITMPQGEKE